MLKADISSIIMPYHPTFTSFRPGSGANSSTQSGTISHSSNVSDPSTPPSSYDALFLQHLQQVQSNSNDYELVLQNDNDSNCINKQDAMDLIQPNQKNSNPIPASVKGAPSHLRQAIRKQQNSQV